MQTRFIQRLMALSMSTVMTLTLLGSISQLFVDAEAQQTQLAQRGTHVAPRA